MVGQNLDHPAFRQPSAPALLDHPPQLLPQCQEALDPALHFRKPGPGDLVRLLAGGIGMIRKFQQGADGIQGKAEVPRMPDECEALLMASVVAALVSGGTWRRGKKADLLIIAHRLHPGAGAACQSADAERFSCHLLNLQSL